MCTVKQCGKLNRVLSDDRKAGSILHRVITNIQIFTFRRSVGRRSSIAGWHHPSYRTRWTPIVWSSAAATAVKQCTTLDLFVAEMRPMTAAVSKRSFISLCRRRRARRNSTWCARPAGLRGHELRHGRRLPHETETNLGGLRRRISGDRRVRRRGRPWDYNGRRMYHGRESRIITPCFWSQPSGQSVTPAAGLMTSSPAQ